MDIKKIALFLKNNLPKIRIKFVVKHIALFITLIILGVAYKSVFYYINSDTETYFWYIDKLNLRNPEENHYTLYYQNNELHYYKDDNLDPLNEDLYEIQVGNNKKYLISHSRGFAMEFPRDAEFDFSKSRDYISVWNDDIRATVSSEFTTYEDGTMTRQYIREYINKYLLDETFMSNNKITLHKDKIEYINGDWMQIIALSRLPAPDSDVEFNTYVYCYIYTGTPMFYRVMFKAREYNDELIDTVYRTLYSFETKLRYQGHAKSATNFAPQIPANWSEETRAFYDELVNGGKIKWGIYQPHNVSQADLTEILELEEKLDYQFDGALEYLYFGESLPVEGLKEAYEDGKTIELTLQTSTVMNEALNGYNPVFDIIDGVHDDKIYALAEQFKEYGHPILFRLNNEMNSDWTSYGVSACLNDPEIYVRLWRKFYDMFEEAGVNNLIWVFNPNDESYPPHGYNSTAAFYPGDKYVHVFGVTGYNTGTFYAERNNEKWKTFDDIYGEIYEKHYETYKNFPWIITEFASSSVGGDKVEWINNMFESIHNYPNIKMAFWFNSADYYKDESDGLIKPARPYWLDENEETLNAFKNGLHAQD